jgi:16S rRNA (guanine527-N7)-methyltransferase
MKIGSAEWSQVIVDGAKAFDLDLDRRHLDLFTAHAKELLHWTKTTNLTTITNPFEVALKHYVDSLAPVSLISPDAALLDIGSGGGFPGIPLKVVMPSLAVTLIDASRKKVNFLKHVIRTLKLEGIQARHIRVEGLTAEPAYVKRFDVIISRALTDLESFTRHGLPLLSGEGVMIALKGRVDPTQLAKMETLALEMMNKSNPNQHSFAVAAKKYELPFTQSQRSIITFRNLY